MEVKVVEKKENLALERTEVKGTLSFTGATPNFDTLKKDLAKSLKKEEDTIAVKEIYTKFGFSQADFRAFAYKSKEKLVEIETKKKVKKEKKAKK